jgi:aspartate kinase
MYKTFFYLYKDEMLVVIISAIGQNNQRFGKSHRRLFLQEIKKRHCNYLAAIKNQHLTTAKYLLVTTYNACYEQLNSFFTEAEWLLHDKPVREYDYYYDQACLRWRVIKYNHCESLFE